MGIYSRYLFPRLLNWGMACERLGEQRRHVLSSARGRVLEIGFGTGLNLPYYPKYIEYLTAIDNNPGMFRLLEGAGSEPPFELRIVRAGAEALPLEDSSFETVVSTWTLCSVGAIGRALEEIWRVLHPSGRFLFLEHGLSADPSVKRWQNRLNPLQRIIGDGCNLNRDMEALILKAGLRIEKLDRFYLEKTPRIMGYTYRGCAVPDRGRASDRTALDYNPSR